MSSERRRIASAATLILVAYGLSRILGAVRELVIANTFGTKHVLDDYRVAFGVPDLLFNLLLAGAISSAFIPVLSEFLALNDRQRAREVAQRVLNAGLLILTGGAALLFVVAPFYVSLIAFGYSLPGPRADRQPDPHPSLAADLSRCRWAGDRHPHLLSAVSRPGAGAPLLQRRHHRGGRRLRAALRGHRAGHRGGRRRHAARRRPIAGTLANGLAPDAGRSAGTIRASGKSAG